MILFDCCSEIIDELRGELRWLGMSLGQLHNCGVFLGKCLKAGALVQKSIAPKKRRRFWALADLALHPVWH